MIRTTAYSLAIWCVLFSTTIHAQSSYNDYKKELRSLDGSRYISKAFEGAERLAQQQSYKNSLDLLDKSVKEARSAASSTQVVVFFNKAEILSKYFPNEDKYLREFDESIEKMLSKDPPLSLIKKASIICNEVLPRSDGEIHKLIQGRISTMNGILNREAQQLIANSENEKLKEFKKLDKEEAFLELEKLKSERVQLEALQVRLSESIVQSEKQLSRRSAIINRMSKDQANKEALIQYNKRIIDSLKFMAQLDSMNLISHERLINDQESKLELQNSKLELQESDLQLKSSRQKLFLVLSLLGLVVACFLAWLFYAAKRSNRSLEKKNKEIEEEQARSEELLLNILPKFIAQELKENSKVKTRTIKQCSVIFTDFINFSSISKKLTPQELIGALDECFRAFDSIITKYNIEKIKTIGDSYMCAGGVPVTNTTHALDAVNAASEMVEFLEEWNEKREKENKIRFDARIGIHSGPIIAGVVGAKKFAYDIWGDTVNVAARIEGQSAAQRINISDSTYQLIKEHYQCIKRGSISVKNMTDLEMYFVDERLAETSLN